MKFVCDCVSPWCVCEQLLCVFSCVVAICGVRQFEAEKDLEFGFVERISIFQQIHQLSAKSSLPGEGEGETGGGGGIFCHRNAQLSRFRLVSRLNK